MSESQGVNSVEVAVSILDVIAEFNGPVRAVDIARVSGLSKSRLHKYLVSLCRSRLLHQDPETNLYFLSNKLVTLAAAVEKQNGVIAMINNALCHFRDVINISTGLVVKKGDNLSLIHYNRSNKNIEIDYRQNTLVPLTHSAAGKVFLTFSGEYKNINLLDSIEQDQIRARGYAISRYKTEGIPGAKSIACPIFNQNNYLIGVAVVMGFLPETDDELHEIAVLLMEVVKQLELPLKPGILSN